MNVLITGGTGFVGLNLAEALLARGDRVALFGLEPPPPNAKPAFEKLPGKVIAALGDVRDEAALDRVFHEAEIDRVIHAAVITAGQARERRDPKAVMDTNVMGTVAVLQAAQRHPVQRVVYLSSVAVYGEANGRVDETTAPRGVSTPYAESKRAAEALCREAAAGGLETVILRPTLIYGPFGETWTVAYATRLASGRWKTLGAAGEGRCNLLYVGDLIRAIQAALSAPVEPGRAFNVNGLEIPTWNQYFERFNALLTGRPLEAAGERRGRLAMLASRPVRTLGKHVLKHHRPLLIGLSARSPAIKSILKRTESALRMVPTPDEARLFRLDAVYDIARAHNELGFAPTTGLERGLALSTAWLVQNGLVPPRVDAAPGYASCAPDPLGREIPLAS